MVVVKHVSSYWNSYKYDQFINLKRNQEAGRKFDLVICIDVLEHIPETRHLE